LSYSVLELIGAADALIAPVRNGIVKPTSRIYANDDVLDLIQQHLSNEHDLSTLIKEATENVGANANLASNEGATDRIKKYMDSQRGPENRPSGGNEAANERTSDDENSSKRITIDNINLNNFMNKSIPFKDDEDEDDEETDGGPTTASLPRTRESSNTSFVPRERAGSHQSRRRQDTNNTADNEENMEEDHEEEEDEDDSDHEMDGKELKENLNSLNFNFKSITMMKRSPILIFMTMMMTTMMMMAKTRTIRMTMRQTPRRIQTIRPQ
jgi:hypothetical protein